MNPVDLNVLILCDFNFRHVGTVGAHIDAFKKYSEHNICVLDARTASLLHLQLNQFDVVVLHYTLVISMSQYIPAALARKIKNFAGRKVLFIQDEYRWVDRTVAAIENLGVDLIFSVINEESVDKVYRHESIRHVRRKVTLTGFVPDELARRNVPAYGDRSIDVGYRARKPPAWLGYFAQEKWLIGNRFRRDADAHDLKCDIEDAESKRLYGRKWIDFVCRCKAMLGTESGASFVDFTGSVQPAVEAFEAANPDATFELVQEKFLEGRDGEIVIHVISPRIFEAAALRTLMILYPGSYSGALTAWRHFVPLERDHSNMEEVVKVLRDPVRAQEIIDNTYEEVALNPTYGYAAMVKEFDADLVESLAARQPESVSYRTESGVGANLKSMGNVERDMRKLERKVSRAYWLRRLPALKLKHFAYRSVHWCIAIFVPRDWQPSVRRTMKSMIQRLSTTH